MNGKESLENNIPQKGVESEEGLHHEFDCFECFPFRSPLSMIEGTHPCSNEI